MATTFRTALIALFLSLPLFAPARATAEEAAAPTQVHMGAYLMRVSNVSQKDGTFAVDMWVWFRWKGDDLKPYETFEVANGKIESKSNAEVSDDEGFHYTSVRVQATVFHDYDVRRFPLDNHLITIEFEDENADVSKLQYVVDDGIALDPGLKVAGWTAALGKPSVGPHVYPTNYGLRSSGEAASTYSRLVVPVSLTRIGYGPLMKQFWISVLSVLLGLLAFRVKATDLDARFGLGVGSIFAASANAYAISDALPETVVITLAEQINFLAIGTIFLSVFMSIASLRLCYAGKDEQSERQDAVSLVVIGIGYVLANAAVLMRHAA